MTPVVAMVAIPPYDCEAGFWITVSWTVRIRVRPSWARRSPTRASPAAIKLGPRTSTVVFVLDVGTDTDEPTRAAAGWGAGAAAGTIGAAMYPAGAMYAAGGAA
jgi:hypothetical protein